MPEFNRPTIPGARDSSLVPTGEVDLVPIALADGNEFVLDFSNAGHFSQAIGGAPLILLLEADGVFYEGQAVTDAAVNMQGRTNIPVQGRTTWHFRRSGGSTVNIKGKLLTGN